MREETKQNILFAVILTLALGLAILSGCQPSPKIPAGTANTALSGVNAQAADGAKQALEDATANTLKATDSNRKAVARFDASCQKVAVPESKTISTTLLETDTLLGKVTAELTDVKAKGSLAVAGWHALEEDYITRLEAAEKREKAKDAKIATLEAEKNARGSGYWWLLVGVCVVIVIGGAAMAGFMKDSIWFYLSGAGFAGGVAVVSFKRIDSLPDWYWMALVGTLLLGGAGLAVWQFVISHKTPAAGAAVPKVGALIAQKLGLAPVP